MAYDPETDLLYGFDADASILFTIDRVSGQGTGVGPTHDPADFGGAIINSLSVGPPHEATSVVPETLVGRNTTGLECVAFPNPFPRRTSVRFGGGRPGMVRLEVYGVDGRRSRSLYKGWSDGGAREIVWDGTDMHGEPVAAGVYFVRLEAAGDVRTEKVVKLRE